MDDRGDALAWMALARTPGLDADTIRAAIAVLGAPTELVRASDAAYAQVGIPPAARAFLSAVPSQTVDRRWLDADDHHLVACADADYPPLLATLPDRPVALYLAGRREALRDPQLAVVGSRHASAQGQANARDLSERLAGRGLAITSGLAEGIDGCAHRGALQASGVTIAVLGCGIDRVYPECHRNLLEQLRGQGAALSAFPLGTPPRRGNFPQRNRLIAGLSLGTLVVEATRHSGSLLTARLASRYGRPVFAVPGSIHNPLARGCHELIKRGAALTENAEDVLKVLNFSAFFANDFGAPEGRDRPPANASGMDKDHKILLDALGFDPVDLDGLIVRTGFKPEAVSSMMLILELEGHVQAAPGGRYSRVANRRAGGER